MQVISDMQKINTVGDLKKYLSEYPDDLPLYIKAYPEGSCCGAENCYCSRYEEEFKISCVLEASEQKKGRKEDWFAKNKDIPQLPKRVVITLDQ